MPRVRVGNHQDVNLNQIDLGPPQAVYITPEPQNYFVGEYLQKQFCKMSKELKKKYECSICLEPLDNKYQKYLLECKHQFHTTCLNDWYKNPNANYEFIEGRYYIFEHSNDSKADLISFKSTYNKDSWIKEIK